MKQHLIQAHLMDFKLYNSTLDATIYSLGFAGVLLSQLVDFIDHHIGFMSITIMVLNLIFNQLWKYLARKELKQWNREERRRHAVETMEDN
jgi:hypothetical protein